MSDAADLAVAVNLRCARGVGLAQNRLRAGDVHDDLQRAAAVAINAQLQGKQAQKQVSNNKRREGSQSTHQADEIGGDIVGDSVVQEGWVMDQATPLLDVRAVREAARLNRPRARNLCLQDQAASMRTKVNKQSARC